MQSALLTTDIAMKILVTVGAYVNVTILSRLLSSCYACHKQQSGMRSYVQPLMLTSLLRCSCKPGQENPHVDSCIDAGGGRAYWLRTARTRAFDSRTIEPLRYVCVYPATHRSDKSTNSSLAHHG